MTQESKHDRELIELLNELRVILPGIQVLFAFLLVVPFSNGFADTTATQKKVYYASFIFTTIATAFLIAPTSYHRLRWRVRDKDHMLIVANRLAIVGTVFLALAMSCVVFFITDFLYSGITVLATSTAALLFSWLWFGLPLFRAARDG